jgi:hypothetical protein
MVHNSKARISNLKDFIQMKVCPQLALFEVSDVKQDGTVTVKFRSGTNVAATELARRFIEMMEVTSRRFYGVSEVQFRFALDQF